jgi:hypothetical protein
MHATKGVFESTIGLLMDIVGKMKDELNTHKDLQVLGIREDLRPQQKTKWKGLPSFSTLHPHEWEEKSNMHVSTWD